MNAAGKIAVGGGLAGLMLALAVVSFVHRRPVAPVMFPAAVEAGPGLANGGIARCRTITVPDANCSAAWEARRRHFFGEDGYEGRKP